MQLDAASIRFFAAHRPRLRQFTYTIRLRHLLYRQDSDDRIADIARSCDILASACENLEVIRLNVTVSEPPDDWATSKGVSWNISKDVLGNSAVDKDGRSAVLDVQHCLAGLIQEALQAERKREEQSRLMVG
jgi:hypothetical protein